MSNVKIAGVNMDELKIKAEMFDVESQITVTRNNLVALEIRQRQLNAQLAVIQSKEVQSVPLPNALSPAEATPLKGTKSRK